MKLRILFLFLVLLMPLTIKAEEVESVKKFNFETGDSINFDKTIDGSSVVAGNNVVSSGKVNGIDMIFGNSVTFKGNSDYAILAGNNIDIEGIINNDGLILGNVINFKNSVVSNRDLFIFGSSVVLSGTFERDVVIYASTVTLENVEIKGNIKVNATQIEVKDSVLVAGELSYNKDAIKKISNEASITNIIETAELLKEFSFQDKIITFITDYCNYLVLFLTLAIFVPSLFKRIERTNQDFSLLNLFSTFGFGTLSLILIPVIFIVLLSIAICNQLAFLLLAIYVLVIWLSIIFIGYLVGYIIWKNFIKKEQNVLLIGLIGITVVTILNNIPVIGTLISIVSLMLGIGVVVRMFKKPEFIESN